MKRITRKLRSTSGASLIIALLFVLMAVFVGGSALAAASANGGRLAARRAAEQEFLSQRSLAALVAEKLTPPAGKSLAVTIAASGDDLVTVTAGDAVDDPAVTRSALTELFYETAVYAYLNCNYPGADVIWVNFQMSGADGQPLYRREAQDGRSELRMEYSWEQDSVEAALSCDTGPAVGRYSVYMTFTESRVRLKFRASVTESGSSCRITWKSPSIIKGGTDN